MIMICWLVFCVGLSNKWHELSNIVADNENHSRSLSGTRYENCFGTRQSHDNYAKWQICKNEKVSSLIPELIDLDTKFSLKNLKIPELEVPEKISLGLSVGFNASGERYISNQICNIFIRYNVWMAWISRRFFCLLQAFYACSRRSATFRFSTSHILTSRSQTIRLQLTKFV